MANKSPGPADNDMSDKPKGISAGMWEKFQALQKRREAVSRKSTEKRIKSLQTEVLNKVKDELNHPDEQAVLREHGVLLEEDLSEAKSRKSESSVSAEDPTGDEQEKWSEIKQYLNVNDHLKRADQTKNTTKSKLEEKIDEAVALGDYKTAEKLSDQMSSQQFGSNIVDAIEARDFMKRKQEEEEKRKSKKQKKLNWRSVRNAF